MEITQIISTVGFPIAAFLLMFWQNTKVIKANTDAILLLKDSIKNNGGGRI